jgi:hypothetical protein
VCLHSGRVIKNETGEESLPGVGRQLLETRSQGYDEELLLLNGVYRVLLLLVGG